MPKLHVARADRSEGDDDPAVAHPSLQRVDDKTSRIVNAVMQKSMALHSANVERPPHRLGCIVDRRRHRDRSENHGTPKCRQRTRALLEMNDHAALLGGLLHEGPDSTD